MSDLAIRVQGLGKRYRVGSRPRRYKALRDVLAEAVRAPARGALRLFRGGRGTASSADDYIWALDDVSFEVCRGEVIGIIGRNGAGKSTLLRILSRVTEPTRGFAEVRGRLGALLEVGTGFHPELTGRENVFLNGAILGMPRAEIGRKFDEIVAFAEVERFIDTPVKHFSSGMYLRLAFAVAAHLEPHILLVDEVLAVGDVGFQQKCLGKMGQVAREGRTVLFVSHNMAAIGSLTSRSLLLDRGRVVADGPSFGVIKEYVAGASHAPARLAWDGDGPGDATARLLACQVGPDGLQSTFDSTAPVAISLVFRVERPAPGLRIGFDVLSSDGAVVFRSYHDDQGEPGELAPGEYRAECTIPANLLNQGLYHVSLRAGIHAVRMIWVVERALSFSVVNVAGVNARYGAARPGIINPALGWRIMPEAPLG